MLKKKIMKKQFFGSKIILRCGETKVAKEKYYGANIMTLTWNPYGIFFAFSVNVI